MTRMEAERLAMELNTKAKPGEHYFAADPELNRWAVFVTRPPLGKVEEVVRGR